MMKVYGSHLCPDTCEAIEKLEKQNGEFQFCNISEDLTYLKEFLAIRDTEDLYKEIREKHGIGIPCFVLEDGTITFTID